MSSSKDDHISRRSWLGLATTASFGAAMLGAEPAAYGAGPGKAGKNAGAQVYNIRDFGAKGDGITLDTAAVQAAIDTCNRDQGGTVLVPACVFVIGTVEMKSNITLHIAAQGQLLSG